jgi:putative heme-binding domain-containing protein
MKPSFYPLTFCLAGFFYLSSSCLANEIALTHQGPNPPFRPLPEFRDHELTVFATAPEVNCPVSVVVEPTGAVLALCDNNAGLGLDKDQGSILRLVDKDGDGRADSMTRFVDNIDTPRGGQFLNGTLYLMHPPHVSTYRDTNGDGIADEHKILAKGFAHDLNYRRGADHSANDLKIGIDGWIYTAIGDFGATATGSDGSSVQLHGGGVIRMRLDGSDLEIYARGTRNTYDLAINHQLDILALDNTNDGDGWNARLLHLTPLAHMGYPNLYKNFSEDAMPPIYDHGGGSGVGAIYFQEPGFPQWLNNRFNTISWGKMYTHHLEQHEATFIQENFETFQLHKLVEVDVDGSSRIYFSTFENGGARTPLGTTVGRIIQAKAKSWQKREFSDLKKLSVDQLITALDQNSNVLRQQAQHELIQRAGATVDAALSKKAAELNVNIEVRIAALYALNLREPHVDRIQSFLKDPQLKEYALRALLDRKNATELNLDQILSAALQDTNPRVQLQAIVAMKKLQRHAFTNQLLQLASNDDQGTSVKIGKPLVHRAIPHTAQRALIEMGASSQLCQALHKPELTLTVLSVISQIHDTQTTTAVIEAMQQIQSFEKKLPFIETLLRLYHKEASWDGQSWWGTKPNSSGPYYAPVSWKESSRIRQALQETSRNLSKDQQKQILIAVRKFNLQLQELELEIEIDPLEQLVDQEVHTESQITDLLKVVKNKDYPSSLRTKAFRAALDIKDFQYKNWCLPLLETLSKMPQDSELYQSLSEDFVQSPSHRISFLQKVTQAANQIKRMPKHIRELYYKMVVGLVDSPLTSDTDRNRLISGLQKNRNTEFIDFLGEQKVRSFENYLKKYLKNGDPDLARVAGKALAKMKTSEHSQHDQLVQAMNPKQVNQVIVNLQGDSELGKQLFNRQSCSACHSILPSQPQKGPYLGTVGNLFDREQLVTHILQPNIEVAQGFQSYNFTLEDGSLVSGFVSERNDQFITVRNMFGVSQKIPTSQVKAEVVQKTSMMPPGLVNNLTLHEFASLLDYLQTLH